MCIWRLCFHVRVFAVLTDRVALISVCTEVVFPRTCVGCIDRSCSPNQCVYGGCVSTYVCSLY